MVLGLLAHVTPSIFFSRILRSEALVYDGYIYIYIYIYFFFFQNNSSTEIIRHYIFIQKLFLTRDYLLVKMASKPRHGLLSIVCIENFKKWF